MQMVGGFVFALVCLTEVAFLVLIVKFLEKSCLLYNLILCLVGCHNKLRPCKYCSLVIFLVDACPLYFVKEVSHQHFRVLQLLLGCTIFCRFLPFVCLFWFIQFQFSSFHVERFLYSTSFSECCVLQKGNLILQATTFSGFILKPVYFLFYFVFFSNC